MFLNYQNFSFYKHLNEGHTNKYRKIPNVSPGLIEVFKHFLGGLHSGGPIFGGAYIRRAFCVSVRVSRPQYSLLYIAIRGKKGVSLGQNHIYFVLKPI